MIGEPLALLRNLAQRLRRRRCTIERIGRATIAYDPQHTIYLRAYYLYCVRLWRDALARIDAPINVVFGNHAVDFANDRRTIRVDIQHEHTLVKPGGRDSEGAPTGSVALADGSGSYLVRIAHRDYLESLDVIVEYSLPNLANIRATTLFPEYLRKAIHLAPTIYATDLSPRRRDIEVITLIHDVDQPRRRRFFEQARAAALPLRNVRGTFDALQLQTLFDRTRILINLRQTDHHDTLEELRILPALQRGVVVISEDVPLRDEVPYREAIVWSRYDELVETARAVRADFERCRRHALEDSNVMRILDEMQQANIANVERALRELLVTRR